MKRWFTGCISAVCLVFLMCQTVLAAQLLVPGGELIGLQLCDGTVTVAAFHETLGVAAKEAGLQVGDRITAVNGQPVSSAEMVQQALKKQEEKAELSVLRSGQAKKITVPLQTSGQARLGVYLKQGITGVGTVTWYDPDTGSFGALGHPVADQNGRILEMKQGWVYDAKVLSIRTGKSGTPGQLMGSICGDPLGNLGKNTDQGVFGQLQDVPHTQPLPVGEAEQIKTGKATIRCAVDGGSVQEYSVEILKVYPNSSQSGRNMLIKVTDERLLSLTGGIVQGMSGSPIIQDGRLIGAVTHVLVNDPTTGYGIFIENMLDAAA